MGFFEKIREVVSGKTKMERLQEKAATTNIRSKQMAAYYAAKEKEGIRVAQAKATAEANSKIRAIHRQYAPQKQYSNPFGSPSLISAFSGYPQRNNFVGKKKIKNFRVI